MKKVVLTYGLRIVEEGLALMREVAEISTPRDGSEAALSAEMKDACAVLVGARPYITKELIESAPQLKHIARVGVGMDSVDIKTATERGIFATNLPEVTADSVAEFTMSLLLSLAKNIPRCDRAVREGQWAERSELTRINIELNGKTHGIVGMGRIGGRVAVRCKAFGMRVLYYKRKRDLELERTAGVEYVPFETLLRESDTISLHTPLTDETFSLMGKRQFESMKRTALLINQSRGKVVNEEALVEALKEGKIAGYATDVYADEPPDPKCELLQFKNVVVSPHLGGVTRESAARGSIVVAEEVVRVLRGEIPKNLVNKEVIQKRSA